MDRGVCVLGWAMKVLVSASLVAALAIGVVGDAAGFVTDARPISVCLLR